MASGLCEGTELLLFSSVHRYSKDPDRVEMKFSRAHINGLASRVESQREVTETFQGREDGLYYRYALLGEPPSIQRSKSKMFDLHSNLDDFPLLVKCAQQLWELLVLILSR